MTLLPESVGGLSRSEKQEMLRRVLLERISRARTAPASFAQERLWFLHRLQPDSPVYNLPRALRLRGALDVPALERALGEVVRRHEALRTVFAAPDGEPVQVIAPYAGFALAVEDLSGADDPGAEARRRVAAEAARPFDLATGPLFRAALLRLAADDHLLLLCMHHVAGDGWSLGVLFNELAALYGAYRDGRGSPLPDLPAQYADHALRQREQVRGQALEGQLAWWRERLAGAPELLELPADRPRPAAQSFRGARERLELSPALAERLRGVGRGEGATLYMVLLATFQALLAKYAGSDDIVVGTVSAGRGRPELQGLIGFFADTLVLRTDLSGDPGFREALRRVRETTLGAYAREVPFDRLVAELRPERSLGWSPLFQVMFSVREELGARPALAGVEVTDADPEQETTKFDLSLAFDVDAGGFRAALDYATDLFDPPTARRMLRHLERVLQQVAADPDARLSALEPMDAAERAQVVEEWNRTDAPYPADRCIHHLFEEQAARTPDAVALVFDGEEITYRALDRRANRLARRLRGLGVGPDVRVGVCLERGVEMVISFLAVLKAGGAYVPLDPAYPAERLALMLDDSAVLVLLTREALRPVLPARIAPRVVSVRDDGGEMGDAGTESAQRAASPDSLAYVTYTSGSTGTPKGVAVPHRAVVRLVMGTDYVELGPDDRVAQASSASFDAATFEIWGALLNGAALVGIPRDVLLFPDTLAAELAARSVTTLFLTTALFNQVSRERPQAFAPLRHLLFGGEAVDPDAVRRVLAAGAPRRLLHVYGPTENTTFSTWHRVAEVPDGARTVPIGRAIAQSRLLVLDTGMRPVPVGAPGELYLGGDGLARGYLGRPGLTAERFVPDPFGSPGARLYRTGDRVRWRAEGALEYLGRLDRQLKIRGFRIEPGEIEAALRRHDGVADCVVVAREDAPGQRGLVAYVVGSADADALRAHLRRSLPEYAVPAAFVAVGAIPLTPNGKVDTAALPSHRQEAPGERHVAPRAPVEEVLAGIWADVLGRERVGVRESFFEVGGHSLLATRVVSRVREVLGVELPLRTLFERPTVAELARAVEEIRRGGVPALPPVVPVPHDTPPLSFAQERLWFLDRLQPGSVYNIPVALRLGGALDGRALERGLGEIVRRHEALRTTFRESGGAAVQVIAPFAGFALPVEDLSGLEAGRREREMRRRASAEAARPFDLAAGPLFRARLLRLGDEDHLLLLSMHHAVADGWSLGVLFRELSVLYGAYGAGGESPLAEPVVQYADFAAWQREQLRGAALERELAYWRERLAGAPALLELPTDHPRPAVQAHRGARERHELPGALLARLRSMGRGEGATLYMVLLAAFQVLLSRYAGTGDVVVGSPVAGRTCRETEGVIGLFVNTLALRADLSGDPTFRALLRRVRDATLGAYEHQDVPFERLVAELRPERSLAYAPLFQVMLTLGDDPGLDAGLPGVRVERVDAELATAKFDLSLNFTVGDGGLRAVLAYDTALFERDTITRMLRHLERVLEQAAADPDARLSALELADEAERALVVDAWNRTGAAYPADRCIHQLFEARVDAMPDAVAVEHADGSLTYRALDARANRLARHLAARGVGVETRVAIHLERSPEMVVAILAVLKAGGCYVPLDPAYPAERLSYILADAGVAVVLTREALRDALPGDAARVCVDGEAAEIAGHPAERLENRAAPRSLAYVIYTSGSTGAPKGVAMEHRALVGHMSWFIRDFGVGADDRVLHKTPVGFDASGWEIHAPLLAGARLVLAAPGQERDPRALVRTVRGREITILQVVPSLLRVLADEPELAECASLRLLFCGGEALPGELCRRLAERLPDTRLVNLYGPTECCIDSSFHRCGEDDGARGVVPIGRPVANTRSYVVDAALRPLPAGVPGELCVGGVQVARGYLGRPALTAERFVPDPFAAEPGARMYRTGDRARWRKIPNGNTADVRAPDHARTDALTHSRTAVLEYLGRLDHQLKIRGVRVEPGEIEAALRRHPGVSGCAVVAREDAPGERRLVAYVVGGAEPGDLRAHLRRSLPEPMVPDAVVSLASLPLLPNGKLDRGALPAPDQAQDRDRYVAPRTPVEEVLAGIWAQVLGRERVGVRENFFEAGGHSLLAMRVLSRIGHVFGVEPSVRAVFEAPTVEEMAARVEALRRAEAPPAPPVVPVPREVEPPLSFAQERLWFLHRLQPGSAAYNVLAALRLEGALDAPALERALGEIVRRHQALRTTFRETGGAPVQVIAPFTGFRLPVEDLSAPGDAEREAHVARRVAQEAARPFDLAAGPLFRPALLRLDAGTHVLLLSLHHVVSDEWSTGVLLRELSALYAAYRQGGESPLAEPAVQYADYAVWQRERLGGEALERELAYWRERLSGAPALLELPTDHPRPPVRSDRGAREAFHLPATLLDQLRALGRREGATLHMVLLAAFQVLLSKYSGSEDVVVGSPVAGRTRREVEGLIGFFVNTLALRTDLSGDPSFREVLRRVREATLGAYEHQEVPFERLVEELRPERRLSHSPLFQVMFVLLEADLSADLLPGLEAARIGADSGTSKFDLTLAVSAHPADARGMLEYSTELFERATIRRMAGHLERVLEQVASAPQTRLSGLVLLDDAERRLVVEEWGRMDSAEPADRCIHRLIEEQAERTPDAAAVVFDDATLTYRDLNEAANRLAHRLLRLGVGPDVRVGICMERGPGMIVSVVAVLKAGGACVPLDPAYPAERLALMLADASMPVLLTQEKLRAALPPPAEVRLLSVDSEWPEIRAEPAENPASPATLENLAYVLYTSGSTGTPKGVMQTHAMLSNLVAWHQDGGVAPGPHRTLQFASLSFDVSFQEIAVTLATGGALVLVDDALRRDPERLVDFLGRAGVERLFLPFVALQAVAEAAHGRALPLSLREVITAGEQLVSTPQIAALIGNIPGCRLINHYGPTETHVATAHILAAEPAAWSTLPPIGRPVASTHTYVLDGAMRPVPVGVPGELYVGGVQVARGYLDRPALTAQRFIPDPISNEPGARLYATGDRVRWREILGESAAGRAMREHSRTDALTHSRTRGELEYLGRADQQVKIRGFRVEPGEIEAALRRREEVRDCAVVAREDGSGERRLVAYVVGDVDAEALRTHLRGRLPEHMVPAAFVSLDALPLTPSGKLDRRALPAPGLAAGGAHAAPRTPVEEVLAGIWAEVLHVERVGMDDNFFALGGHSLLATRVISRIREALDAELPLRALFERPTVAELAQAVEEVRRAGLPVPPPVIPVVRDRALPLSFAQERLWFLERLWPGSAIYNIPVTLRLDGVLDEAALERALGEIIRRHDALRTTFADTDGVAAQVITPFAGFSLPIEDLSGLSEAEREMEAKRRTADEATRPFDLGAGPLFRAKLLRLGNEEHVLVISMHHVVSDGWSLGVLFRELTALYAAFSQGGESSLPELAVQYADFAVWQREQLNGEVLDRQLAYWKERLAGAPALLELPTDHPRPATPTYRGAHEPIDLPGELLERLEALGRREGATLYMVLLAAFQVLLSKYSGSDDVVVGSPIAGRTRREVEALIGFFINTLVLRSDLSGDPSFRGLLRRVRETTLGAYEHQDVPFEKLVEELRPERSLSHAPLFQALFTLQSADRPDADLPGLRMRAADAEVDTVKFDVALSLAARHGGLRGWLSYSTDLFERSTARRMVGHLRRVLEQVAADADRCISAVELLGGAERSLVIEAWNRTDAPYPAERCIHHLFAEQAARTPDAVALVHENDSLTYRELDERANRLAHHLGRLGVGSEVRVGVCLERSPELIVALFAVMKAGGAYVPLDPAYPPERLALTLADAGAPVLVTQQTLRGLLPPREGMRIVSIDADAAEIARESADHPRSAVSPRNLAYLIYTSGSTGTPKGVAIEHASAVAMLAWGWSVYSGAELAGVLASTSICFDLSVFELFLPLARGGRVILVENALALPRSAAAEQVRLVNTVPSAGAALLKSGGLPAGVRTVNLAGEPLKAELVDALYARGVERVYDLYGPSEDTTYSTFALRRPGGPATIGGPISNSHAYVLDAGLRPLPVGVPGELYLGGRGLARGYLGRPGLTAERFVPDPFAAEPGARLYRTGDRVRRGEDGALEYLGRLDHQVKIRGFRIEPGEIEAALRRHPGVADCVVTVREDAPGDKRLAAYVAGSADADELRAHLRRSLPDYMLPAAFILLDALPLTPNGKVDRAALPAPERASAEDRYAAPDTPLEEALAAAWAAVLRRERVGVHDNFFEIGGHSLLLVELQDRLAKTLGREVTLVDLFRYPTVRSLHTALMREGARAPAARRGEDRGTARRAAVAEGRGAAMGRGRPRPAVPGGPSVNEGRDPGTEGRE